VVLTWSLVVSNIALVVRENSRYARNRLVEYWVPWHSVGASETGIGRWLTLVLGDGRRLPVCSGGALLGGCCAHCTSSTGPASAGRHKLCVRQYGVTVYCPG